MSGHDLIAVGGSAGGVEALLRLAPTLPRELGAAVLVTIHVAPGSASNLPTLLSAHGPLPARFARDGEAPVPGTIHVARADRHLELAGGKLRLTRGPTENGHRPAVDAMFRSAALDRGPSVVGVVLSGALDDGAVGLVAIRREGGVAVVQDPREATYPSMPRSALREAGADHVVPVDGMGPLLGRLVELPPGVAGPDPSERSGPSVFTCPDCGGVLDLLEGEPQRLRCQVGHRWSSRALLRGQAKELEAGLWAAYRTLVEHERLLRSMEDRAVRRGQPRSARRYAARAEESQRRARVICAVLGHGPRAEDRRSHNPSQGPAAATSGEDGSPKG